MKPQISYFSFLLCSLLTGLFSYASYAQTTPVCDNISLKFTIIDTCTMSAQFSNTSTLQGTNTYKWFFSPTDSTTDQSPSRVYPRSGNYAVKLYSYSTDPLCPAADSIVDDTVRFNPIDVELRKIPNVFSPNGDGINDEFTVTSGKTRCVTYRLSIYTRWGERVFDTEDRENMHWDGKNGNIEMPEGVYYYVMTGEGFKHSGSVTLIR